MTPPGWAAHASRSLCWKLALGAFSCLKLAKENSEYILAEGWDCGNIVESELCCTAYISTAVSYPSLGARQLVTATALSSAPSLVNSGIEDTLGAADTGNSYGSGCQISSDMAKCPWSSDQHIYIKHV